MKSIDSLTNERLRNLFNNQFELVNYTIRLAEYFIHSGKRPFATQDVDNLASQILEIVATGKDYLKSISTEKEFVAEIETKVINKIAPVIIIEEEEEDDEDDEDEAGSEPQAIEAV